MDMGQTRKNPSPRNKTRLSFALHQPARIPWNADRNRILDLGRHRSASSISFPANLWRLPTSSSEHYVCSSSDMQFRIQQRIGNKQSSKLGIPNQEHSLSGLQRNGPSRSHAHVLPVLRRPIQAPL